VTPTVVVVDATPFIRLAVRAALASDGMDVVAGAGSAADALEIVLTARPDALLIDADLDPDMVRVRRMADAVPATAIIVLSADNSLARAMAAVRAGACGFIPKETSPERLPAIVRGALDGEAAFPRRLVRQLLAEVRRAEAWRSLAASAGRGLSGRESEVLALQCEDLPDHRIAERLSISQVTVRRHAASAARKLGARDRKAAVAMFRGGCGYDRPDGSPAVA